MNDEHGNKPRPRWGWRGGYLAMAGLIAVLGLSGCTGYKLTLNNGTVITTSTKPKFDQKEGVYRFRSGGKEQTIPAFRVQSIEPR